MARTLKDWAAAACDDAGAALALAAGVALTLSCALLLGLAGRLPVPLRVVWPVFVPV
jgi:hypothetical protein